MFKAKLYHNFIRTAGTALMFAALFFLPLFGERAAASDRTIPAGVFVGPVDVGGLSESAALGRVKEFISKAGSAHFTMVGKDENDLMDITPAELGLTWTNPSVVEEAFDYGRKGNAVKRYKELKDLQHRTKRLELTVSLDDNNVKSWLSAIAPRYEEEARDYELHRENGAFVISSGSTGLAMDEDASKRKIMNTVSDGWDYGDARIELVISVQEPRGAKAELEKVKDLLGTYTTSFKSSGDARSANVRNGCRLAQDVTVYPGEEYSVLNHITPFSEDNGYKMAGSYLNGEVVDSLGGGICQVSTTLYNAVLLAELQVVERNSHSMIVNYVKPSADAAIAESSHKDFRFINNTEAPIYIEGFTTDDKHITFNIYGKETRDPGHEISFESETLETIEPETETIKADASQPAGYISVQSAHIGYRAQLWKIVTENGTEVSRDVINKSSYKMVPRTAVVGVATDNPVVADRLAQAVASGSIDQVRAVANAVRSGGDLPEVIMPAAPAPEAAADPEAAPVVETTSPTPAPAPASQEPEPAPEPAPEAIPEPAPEPEPEPIPEPIDG